MAADHRPDRHNGRLLQMLGYRADLDPVDQDALEGPAALEAKPTSDSDLIEGGGPVLLSYVDRIGKRIVGPAGGAAYTDEWGTARLTFEGGLQALQPPGYTIDEYRVELRRVGYLSGRRQNLCGAARGFPDRMNPRALQPEIRKRASDTPPCAYAPA